MDHGENENTTEEGKYLEISYLIGYRLQSCLNVLSWLTL